METALSVVIPAYESEFIIGRAVRSALAAGADEVIVVDDGSTDDTGEQAARAGARVLTQANSGAAAARALGADHVSGRWIIFLDADDELVPAGVAASVKQLVRDGQLAVSAGTVIGVGGVGGLRERSYPIRFSPVTTEALLIVGHGPWPPAAAVVRRDSFEQQRELDPAPLSPRFAEDYELLIRLSMVGGVHVHPEPACRYDMTGGKSVRSALAAIEAKEQIRHYYADHLGLDVRAMTQRERLRAAHVRQARADWSSGDRLSSVRHLSMGIVSDPRMVGRRLSKVLGTSRRTGTR